MALIDECRVARLGMVAPGGAPQVLPVCFAFVEGRFAIAIDEKPKSGRRLARLRNIVHEPRVSLLLDRYEEDWTRLAWLRIEGKAVALDRGDANIGALAALRARYPQYASMDLESRPLIVLEPLSLAGWRWASG